MSVTGTAHFVQDAQSVVAFGFASGFRNPTAPNLPDFLTFLSTSVQIPPTALPPVSPWPQWALNQAVGLVLGPAIAPVPGQIYTIACYNAATHILIGITPDVAGQDYFTNARSNNGFSLIQPKQGIVVASSDESTSTTLAEPNWAAKMTVGQLDFYRTPWGRAYLSYQQSYGPSIVGLT